MTVSLLVDGEGDADGEPDGAAGGGGPGRRQEQGRHDRDRREYEQAGQDYCHRPKSATAWGGHDVAQLDLDLFEHSPLVV